MSEGGGTRLVRALRNLFDDLSLAQVGAGALAAVTSMLLSSQIGIAGSVIGAAVGSVVSAVSSQVYKKVLAASADKIKDIPAAVGAAGASHGDAVDAKHEDAADAKRASAASDLVERAAPAPSDSDVGVAGEQHENDSSESQDAAQTALASNGGVTEKLPVSLTSSADVSADAVLLRAHVERERRKKRRVICVSVISSLAAVALSAALVYAFTEGEGLGTKPDPVLTSARTQVASSSDGVAASTVQPDEGGEIQTDDAGTGADASASSGKDDVTGADTTPDAKKDASASSSASADGTTGNSPSDSNTNGNAGSGANDNASDDTGGTSVNTGDESHA